METIDILDDEKEEGEISLEDVSSSEEGGIGHLTCNYVINRTRSCPDCKSWGECAPWCTMMCHSKSRRDPVKGKENRHHVREAGCATAKHIASTLQEKNDDLVPISSDSDMEIVGLTDTSNRSKTRIKKKKRKKRDYDIITIDDLISPASVDLPITEFGTLKKTHYRELSPVRRSGRSRVISRSPIRRHRSPVKTRSPIRSSRSPLNHIRSPMLRRSPRRVRSPKRISPHRSPKRSSPHRSPKRSSPHRSEPVRTARRPSRLNSPPSTRSYANRHGNVTKLLKKVKQSESSVDRTKEHQPSLKEKLSNMLKKHPDSNDNAMCFKEKTNAEPDIVNDADDEEDLALLRQKALETKQKKSNRSSDHGSMDVELEKNPAAKNDDQDEEALQLRMIALRSAVMKKHQNRVRRGIRTNKKPSRSESPFNQSFLDDIPVPGDELLKFASPPCTPLYDSNHIEDMELDTDIEGEKEAELPYSPTDKITTHVPIDTSLLGIEPSDVSFINVNETNNKSPIFNDAKRVEGMPLLITDVASCYDNAYLTSHTYEASQYYAYSPSQQCTDIFLGSDFNDEPEELSDHLRDCQSDDVVCDLIDGICCQVDSSTGVASTQVADARPIPVLTSLLPIPSTSPKPQQIIEQSTDDILLANVDSTFRENKCTYEARKISECPLTTISPTMYAEPVSNESVITIDDLPETKKDSLSSLVIDRNLPTTDYISKEAASCQAVERETLQEPLYMQGVPDITKDANKIPTLINKTLVPAPILRSNKRLQQPLPITKKCETHIPEPSFKSAEMQPVIVTTNVQSAKNGSNFKPIKLRVAKKSAPILTASVAFDNLTNENSENNASETQGGGPSKDSCEVIEHSATANTVHTVTVNDDVVLARKRRKRIKKDRSKSFGCIQLLAKKRNNSDDDVNKDVNIKFSSTIERQITESDLSESNNDNKAQESLMENEESKLQNAIDTQESISCSNITVENKDAEKSDLSPTLSAPTEHSQEGNIESRLSINSASDNLDSDASNKASKDVGNRRQSVDEDENELRAILLASLKRTKLIDINSNSSAISITTNCTTTNTQTSIQQTLTDTISIAAINSTQATVNSNVPLSTRLSSLVTQEKKINRVSSSLLASGNKKKINSVDAVKGPPKKMMKKSVIPASTKVVNNAKKYQNMIVQRRLNLRKLDNNTTKSNENVWSNANPSKTSLHVSDTQRFVISLGSDTDSESDGEKRRDSVLVPTIEKQQTQDISADFEQSLHKFLRDMRKEQEQSAVAIVTKPVTTRDAPLVTKGSSNMHTPLAVRHLPASQQEEYRRLKQEILEREKLKLQRKVADNNNGGSNNKLLNTNTASSLIKSLSSSEKKSMPIKQNSDKSTESEKNSQQSSGESKKKDINAARNSLISNVFHTPANSNLSLNVDKHTNSAHSSAKGIKKTIPNNLSIRITNEIAPNHTAVESRTVENSCEKQSANDKPQNNRPALRALTKEEINRKYVQVLLKSDISGRVVTINDRPALRHDTTNVNQSEKPVGNDVSIEILEERQRNNENSNNTSVFSNASTVKLSDFAANTSKPEHEDIMMEATMSLSQYEAERREINCNTSMSLSSENNSNNAFHKSDSENVDNKGNTDDVWDALKKDVKEELDSLINLPKTEQERYLRDTEHKLVARRYTVLDHLAEMSGNLRQWDMEKELQSSLASEVRKLKEQLKMAEERLQLQRDRVNSMGPKVSTARQKINAGRRECFKLSRICSTLGNRLMGKIYKLPEAGGQLLSDKLKEVANHTRQFTKKKRIQFNDASENSNSNLLRQISESSKDTRVEEDLSLQEQPVNDATDVAGSKNDTCHLKQYSDGGNLSTSESSFTLNLSQTFLNQLTPAKRKETSTNASELHNDDQVTPPNQDASEPKLYQSTPVEQNKKHRQRSCSTHDPITSSELGSSSTDPFLCQDSEQNNKKMLPSPPLSMSTTKTTETTTTTTTTTMTIAPYESILSHLKIPRNTNPHGILCPYEMMGICRDEDCQYIHQSRNQT